jgi:hypothetical protein
MAPLEDNSYRSIYLLLIAIFSRLVMIIFDAVAGLNPHTGRDTVTFAKNADKIADQFLSGDFDSFFANASGGTNESWGLLLSPFWMIPGPSEVYAAIFVTIMASVGIYNVYIIVNYYSTHQAGIWATLPLIFAPNIIAVHGSILRDGVVLFSLTASARYLAVTRLAVHHRIVIPIACLGLSYYLRSYTLVIFTVAIFAGLIAGLAKEREAVKKLSYFSPLLGGLIFLIFKDAVKNRVLSVASVRSYTARGRAAYLPEVVPESLIEAAIFSWIGFLYFMFAPFPWQISTIGDFATSVESTTFFLLCIAALIGVKRMIFRDIAVAVGLLIGLFVGGALFGLGSGNYGTTVRHRQMFTWVICFFAGIGLDNLFKIK